MSGTEIWCDARHDRSVCFLSAAHALRGARHAQLIASPQTLALLPTSSASRLAVPFGQPFQLGNLRLELFRSGYCAGGASLLIDGPDRRIVYAGIVNPRGSILGGAMDQRTCDVLVLAGPDTMESPSTPSLEELAINARDTVERHLAQESSMHLQAEHLGLALDLISALADVDAPIATSTTLGRMATQLGIPTRRYRPGTFRSGVAVHLAGTSQKSPSRQTVGRGGDIHWPTGASFEETAAYVRGSRAKRVYLLGLPSQAEALAAQLDGIEVSSIAPPMQLSLFSDVTAIA